jgi:hypothetical protein
METESKGLGKEEKTKVLVVENNEREKRKDYSKAESPKENKQVKKRRKYGKSPLQEFLKNN